MSNTDDQQGGKKTETIEVRVPYETKIALAARSERDGQSMSNIVRTLIDQYLNKASTATPQFASTKRLFSLSRKKIVGALTAFSVVTALVFTSMSPSLADDIELSISGQIVKFFGNVEVVKNENADFIKGFADEVYVTDLEDSRTTEYGKTITIRHPMSETAAYVFEFTPKESNDDKTHIAITIKYVDGADERILATSSTLLKYQKKTHIQIFENKDSPIYLLNITAKKL